MWVCEAKFMNKKLLIVACVLLGFIQASGQGSYTSANNNTGDWTDPIWTEEFGWMADQPSATEVGGSYNMNIYGYVTRNGDLLVSGGGTLNIYDTLVITGNLSITSSGGINVQPGGLLVVLGDFFSTGGGNKINVIGTGRAAIVGEYEQQQGSVTTGSAYYIYDTTPAFTSGGCNGGASVDGTNYTCPPPNTAVLTDLLDTSTDLANNDPPLKDFLESLGVMCGFANTVPTTNNQSVCNGSTPTTLTGNAISSSTYLWESSTTSASSGFASAAGTNNAQNYSPSSLTQTTWYRRKVTRAGCTNTSSVVTITILVNGTWTGANSSVWTTGTNWCGGVPTTVTDAIIPVTTSGRYPSVSSAANCRDLLIHSGASVTISSSSLSIYGNLTNNGTFAPNTSSNTVFFRGTAQQTVTGGPYSFYALTVNNSADAQVVFQSNVAVSNTLTLVAGKVNMSGNTLTLGTGGGSTGTLTSPVGTNAGIMNGVLERWMTSSSTVAVDNYRGYFPMATANYTRGFWVAYPNSADRPSNAGTIRVSHAEANTVTTGLSITDGATTIKRRQNSSWTVTTANSLAGGAYSIKAGGTGFGTVGLVSDLRVMRSNNVTGSNGTPSGTTTDFLAQRTGITITTLASTFYIGSINDTQSPLPVELLSFTGEDTADGVLLKWTTSMEKNFDHFEIERAADGVSYAYLTSVTGRGALDARTDYTFVDGTAPTGRVYYRLKNVDLDGTFDYSRVVPVMVGAQEARLAIYPNPVVNKSITVKLTGESSGTLILVDQVGKQLMKADLVAGEQEITLDDKIKPGIYLARVFRTSEPATTIKLRVE